MFQLLELPTELDDKETNQALLLTERRLFLESLTNKTSLVREDMLAALEEYEAACSQASQAGIDIVSKAGRPEIVSVVISSSFIVSLRYLTVSLCSPTLLTGISSSPVFSASQFSPQ